MVPKNIAERAMPGILFCAQDGLGIRTSHAHANAVGMAPNHFAVSQQVAPQLSVSSSRVEAIHHASMSSTWTEEIIRESLDCLEDLR